MPNKKAGFSLIELMVVIGIVSVLMSLGLPVFINYLHNARLRVAAESFLSGVQAARSEAIRLNSNVQFLLTNETPAPDDGSDANFPVLQDPSQLGRFAINKVNWNANGYNWLIRTVPSTLSCGQTAGDPTKACWFVSAKLGAEGGGRKDAGASTPVVTDSSLGQPIIVFTPFGGTTLTATALYKFSNTDGGACSTAATPTPLRCLNVFVTVGGQARLCDPALTPAQIAAGDTRGC